MMLNDVPAMADATAGGAVDYRICTFNKEKTTIMLELLPESVDGHQWVRVTGYIYGSGPGSIEIDLSGGFSPQQDTRLVVSYCESSSGGFSLAGLSIEITARQQSLYLDDILGNYGHILPSYYQVK